jgi:hypothetical protein
MIQKNETVAIGWCDNGTTDGKFTEGLLAVTLAAPANGMKIDKTVRVSGNQISRQRQRLLDHWYDNNMSDWLLWVDSDIVLTIDALYLLWHAADAETAPAVSGVYFISKEPEGTTMRPFPCVFMDLGENKIQYLHPLPEMELVDCDLAGFGLFLMHRSVVEKMREKLPTKSFFAEQHGSGADDEFVGEDIIFFRKMKQAGIQLKAHTGALVKHMKRFSLDFGYYALYWSMEHLKEKAREEQTGKTSGGLYLPNQKKRR